MDPVYFDFKTWLLNFQPPDWLDGAILWKKISVYSELTTKEITELIENVTPISTLVE